MYLEGENKIQVQQTGTTAPAGISVAEKAQITIDCKPDADGSLEVVSQARSNSGAAIGGAPEAVRSSSMEERLRLSSQGALMQRQSVLRFGKVYRKYRLMVELLLLR